MAMFHELTPMSCRIHEWEKLKGEMSPRRIENALFLMWAVNYENGEVKTQYEEAMSFYSDLIDTKQAVSQQGQKQNESKRKTVLGVSGIDRRSLPMLDVAGNSYAHRLR